MFGTSLEERLRRAAAPSLERMQRDGARLSEPLRRIVVKSSRRIFDTDVSIAALFEGAGLSARTLEKRFRAELGMPLRAYLAERRLETARRLLQEGGLDVREVTRLVGYQTHAGFSRAYRRWSGETPVEVLGRASAREPATPEAPRVAARYRAWCRARVAGATPTQAQRFVDAIEHAHTSQVPPEAAHGEEARATALLLPRLAGWSPAERRAVPREGFRFRTTALFEGLLRASREGCRDDRPKGVRLALVALDSLEAVREHLDETEYQHQRARGLAGLGNAYRLVYDFSRAEKAFREARAHLGERSEPGVLAEVFFYEGSLRKVQRRTREALELFCEAEALCIKASRVSLRLKTLVSRGFIYHYQGNTEPALADFRLARKLCRPDEDTYLAASIETHLALAHSEKGLHPEAAEHLARARSLLPQFPSRAVAAHLARLEGLLAVARGDLPRAIEWMSNARKELEVLQDHLHLAVLDLELAIAEAQSSHLEKAEPLAAEALARLEMLDLSSEILAARSLLHSLLEKGRVSARTLLLVRHELELTHLLPRWPNTR